MRVASLDRWLGPLLMALAAAWLWLAYAFIPGARAAGEPGPRAFPVLLGAVLLVLGAVMTVSALRARRDAPAGEEIPAPDRREAAFVFGIFGVLVLYAFLLEHAGFLVATPLIVVILLRGALKVRSWVTNLAMASGITAVCWLVFVVLLEAPLPRGSWRWLF